MADCLTCADAANYSLLYTNSTTNDTVIDKYYFYQTAQICVLWALLVAIVAGNSTVVLALLLTKPRKSRMNFFIMHLAIADLLVGLISVLPDLIHRITITWYAGSITCKLVKYLQGVVTYSSTYVLVALSVDRCDAITHPMNFTGSWRRARALIVAAWLVSFLFCIPMLLLFDTQEVEGLQQITRLQYEPPAQDPRKFLENEVDLLNSKFWGPPADLSAVSVLMFCLLLRRTQCWAGLEPIEWRIWMTTVCVLLFILPALIISACYGVIVITIRQKSHRVLGRKATTVNRQYNDDMESRRASSRGIIPKAKIKTVKMTFVIVFVFVLCWSPYMVFDLLQVYGHIDTNTASNMAIATLIQSLAPLNSAANPVIYFIFSNRIFVSLRNIPPYKWLWCWVKTGDSPAGNESRAHTELLTSSHRRTRRDLTVRMKEDSLKYQKQRLHQYNSSNSRKVRLHLPEGHQTNNNCTPQRRQDTFL